jgi:ribosomal protein L7/L12
MPAPPRPIPPEVLAALRRGNPIEAIQLLREASGLGLKDAKEVIDAHRRAKAGTAMPAPPVGTLPSSALDALLRGSKMEAIKLLREHTGVGLKEAKDAVDARAAFGKPSKLSPGEVPRSHNPAAWIAVAAIAVAAISYFLR